MADDRFTPLRAAFKTVFGSSDAQAEIAAGALYDLCDLKNGALIFRPTGKPMDAAETRAMFEGEYSFLLPPKKPIDPAANVKAAMLASAANGNITALGALTRELGGDAAKARELVAAEKTKGGTDNKGDHASNPWSKAGWSLKGQGAVVRAMGLEKAGQIAAAVQSKIGATRPTQ